MKEAAFLCRHNTLCLTIEWATSQGESQEWGGGTSNAISSAALQTGDCHFATLLDVY